MSDFKHIGSVSGGKLSLYSRSLFLENIKTFEGKDIEIVIRKAGKRSNSSNKFYWGAVIPIVKQGLKDMGIILSTERVHDLLKLKFLKIEVADHNGEVIEMIRGSSELNTEEFSSFIEQIKQWASEYLGVVIPEPNEQLTIEL